MKHLLLVVAAAFLANTPAQAQLLDTEQDGRRAQSLNVMTWNIWHGGREDGEDVGPARVIEVIRDSGADLVAMQETYGSGERIAEGLGFHFSPRGTNVSILSRYAILEDISVHDEFQCAGALIELPDSTRVAFYSIWLPYSDEIWEVGSRDTSRPETMLAACRASEENLKAIREGIQERLADEKYEGVPILVSGDFNSMSHLDYGEVGWDQFNAVVDWPTSRILTRHGFVDSYRACNPSIDRLRDSTWTPRFPDQEQDRIDFIYSLAPGWEAISSRVLRTHAERFPSDHAALLTTFRVARQPWLDKGDYEIPLRAVSYNIKHGEGMDGQVDLDRCARVLSDLEADFIGLQEVDLGAMRSGGRNQANELARTLSLHPAFGSFMDFQGGRYGMAILSRFPIVSVESLRLPDGNEPRIALIVESRLPNGETILVVNVHFDWVRDDAFRFAQAKELVAHLRGRSKPFILLGDFNDVPGSRTLALFEELASEISKPASDRFTFPSTTPEREIDFIWCSPTLAWRVSKTTVIEETIASDHRPVVADLTLRIPR